MSRIRSIKPEAFLDESLWDAEQSSGLPLFRAFTGLWCQADREGRFEWRPRQLKASILPYWEGDFTSVLTALEGARFVASYEVEGRKYGVVRNFMKHQVPNAREPQSKLPAPPSTCTHGPNMSPHVHDGDTPSPSLPVPLPFPDGGEGGNQTETRCPLDLTDRCERAGIPEQFAKTHGVSIEAVRAQIRETVAFWTIGPGMGRPKRNWLRVVRNRLHELAKQGLLVMPVGIAAEHPEERQRKREAADKRAAEARERDVKAELEKRGAGPVTLGEAVKKVQSLGGQV